MSLQAILDAIIAEGSAQIEQIEAEGNEAVKKMIKQAQATANQEREQVITSYQTRGRREQELVLLRAQQDALQTVNSARDKLVDDALQQLRNRLENVRDDKQYKNILPHMINDAIGKLSSSLKAKERPVIFADSRDEYLLRDIAQDFDVHYTLNCMGGVIVSTPDGRITVDNTLDERLKQATPSFRQMIARHLSQNGRKL